MTYVPAHWPTGPRELRPGRFVCPFEGCKNPVGITVAGQGYMRTALIDHIPTHGGLDGVHSLRRGLRLRVKFLRLALRQPDDDHDYHFLLNRNRRGENLTLHQHAEAIICDLEQIGAWESSCRHLQPFGPADEESPGQAREPIHPSSPSIRHVASPEWSEFSNSSDMKFCHFRDDLAS